MNNLDFWMLDFAVKTFDFDFKKFASIHFLSNTLWIVDADESACGKRKSVSYQSTLVSFNVFLAIFLYDSLFLNMLATNILFEYTLDRNRVPRCCVRCWGRVSKRGQRAHTLQTVQQIQGINGKRLIIMNGSTSCSSS